VDNRAPQPASVDNALAGVGLLEIIGQNTLLGQREMSELLTGWPAKASSTARSTGVPEIIGQNTLAQQRVLTDLLMRQGTCAEPG
jgi:hypothetical protein